MNFETFSGDNNFIMRTLMLPNPLDPRTAKLEGYTLLQPETAPNKGEPRQMVCSICLPPKVIDKFKEWRKNNDSVLKKEPITVGNSFTRFAINLTIFFAAPDNDLSFKTLGLKYFFQHVDNTIAIVIPNSEGRGQNGQEPKNFGVTSKMIEKLILSVIPIEYKFFDLKITCLTAYSAGYGGLVQSINNNLFSLNNIEKIVFYDCLYRTDKPALPRNEALPQLFPDEQNTAPDEVDRGGHRGSVFNTRRAIIKLKNSNPNMQVIAYCATSGGSPKYLRGKPTYTVEVDKLIDLRASNFNDYLFALSLTRSLFFARDEGIIGINQIPAPFVNLYNKIIPQRGQIASTTGQLRRSKTGFTPTTTLEAWGNLNKDLILKAKPFFTMAADLVGKQKLYYDGYPSAGNAGGMLHIGQIVEFAWEEFI